MNSPLPAAAPARGSLAVFAALAIVYIVWGSTYLAIRFALEGGYPPLTMVSGVRFVLAGGVMYAVLRWRGIVALRRAATLVLVHAADACVIYSTCRSLSSQA